MPETFERCQACRARLAEDGICSRCGSDFSLARQAMEQAGRCLERAFRALAVGDRELARRQIDASLAMHRQPLAQAIREFLDSEAVCMESGHPGHTPLPPTALAAADEPDRIRPGECWNPDSALLSV